MSDKIRRFRWRRSNERSAADLIRECGEKLTDRELWRQFQERFEGLIFIYVMRSLRLRHIREDVADIVPDLAQNVYVRLVQGNGRVLRSFRGTTDFSVRAFLGRIAASVVADHLRQITSDKRSAQIISIDQIRTMELDVGKKISTLPETRSDPMISMLRYIDMERVVEGDPDQKNARRNALIFLLHHVEGFDAGEIANFPGFGLTKSGVQAILARLRKRIQNER
jgi:RNA polymerase sigma factor (sigma-70 family)